MAKRTSKPKGETADATPTTAETADGSTIDRVAMPSRRSDGSPDQTEGFERLLPEADEADTERD